MAQSGRQISTGFAKESSRGTYAAATYFIPRISGDFDDTYDVIEHSASYGTLDAVTGSAKSKQWSEGNFTANVGATSIGLILKALFGTENAAAAAGETIVYEHTFTLQTSAQHPTLSLSKKDGVQGFGYTNCAVTSLEIAASTEDYVTFTAGFRGKAGATQTVTPAFTTETFFTRSTVTLVRATSLSGLASGTAVAVKDFKVTFTPEIVDDDILGSADPNDFLNSNMRIEAEFTLKYDAATFHDFVANQTATWYRLLMIDTVTIGNAEKYSLQIDLMNVVSKEWSRKDDNDKITEQVVKLVGKYNTTDAKSVQVILTNLLTTAY